MFWKSSRMRVWFTKKKNCTLVFVHKNSMEAKQLASVQLRKRQFPKLKNIARLSDKDTKEKLSSMIKKNNRVHKASKEACQNQVSSLLNDSWSNGDWSNWVLLHDTVEVVGEEVWRANFLRLEFDDTKAEAVRKLRYLKERDMSNIRRAGLRENC